MNALQFSENRRTSDSALNVRKMCLPLQFYSPVLFPGVTLGNRCAECFGECFDPRCQRFYRLTVRLRSLERL